MSSFTSLQTSVDLHAAGIAFGVLFGLATLAQIVQDIKLRQWIFIIATLGTVGEMIGWIGAAIGYNVSNFTLDQNDVLQVKSYAPLLMELYCLLIAPRFFSVILFHTLGRLVHYVDPEHEHGVSPLKAKKYVVVFTIGDVLALVLQAVGAAFIVRETYDSDAPKFGWIIALTGIALQLANTFVFSVLEIIFFVRAQGERLLFGHKTPYRANIVAYLLMWLTVLIMIRLIYRVVQLAAGAPEWSFIVFDAVAMLLFVLGYTILHPGFMLRDPEVSTDEKENDKNGISATQLQSFR